MTSAASNSAEITATASAPASISVPALSGVMPPMATTGTFQRAFAVYSSGKPARTAPGLVLEGKKLPNTM